MQDTAKNPNVLEACSVEGRLDNLRMLSEQLETCQKSLSEYLDTKRCAFPRSANPKVSLHQVKHHCEHVLLHLTCTYQESVNIMILYVCPRCLHSQPANGSGILS